MKRFLTVLILILALLLSGCEAETVKDDVLGAYKQDSQNGQQDQNFSSADVTLLFYPDMDTNPVTTNCLANSQILKLVYEPLITLDDSFKPSCVIAKGYVQTANTIVVTINEKMKFSDGSPVTAYDVVKTYDVAKKDKTSPYHSSVSLLSDYRAKDDYTVEFVFKYTDTDAVGILDLPIMKNGKEGIGCGPYVLQTLNGKQVLMANEQYSPKANIKTLRLVETKSDEFVTSLFSAGELDLLSLPGNDDLSLTSLRNYTTITYPSNNLVYIGINTSREFFADAKVRRQISACIDRQKITSQALVGLAEPTVYPFNPDWYKLDVYNVNSNIEYKPEGDLLSGKTLLLIVPEGSDVKNAIATALAANFKELSINLEIKVLNADDYKAKVESGDFDLYLGETALPRTMDPTYLYAQGAGMNYSGYVNAELDSIFVNYKNTNTGLDKYLEKFLENMPIIPIAFRKNVIYSTQNLDGFDGLSAWNSYGNFEKVIQK